MKFHCPLRLPGGRGHGGGEPDEINFFFPPEERRELTAILKITNEQGGKRGCETQYSLINLQKCT